MMKKKISQIVTYSVLGVVVLGFILCSLLKINFMPEMNLPQITNGDKIQITLVGTAKAESSNENIKYNDFLKEYKNSFKLSILYSVFSGKINAEFEVEETKSEPSYSGYKVQFIFTESYTLKKDGKEVPKADNSSTPITYNTIVFDVVADKGLADTSVYFYLNGETTYYKVSTIANFDSLYEYISNISMFGE